MCEEHVAEFTVAVGPEELPAEAAGAQVPVLRQNLNASPSLTSKERIQVWSVVLAALQRSVGRSSYDC